MNKKKKSNAQRLGEALKPYFTTTRGWLAIILATIVNFAPGLIPLIVGIVLRNRVIIEWSIAALVFIASPIIPQWLIIPTLTFAFYKLFSRRDNKKTD